MLAAIVPIRILLLVFGLLCLAALPARAEEEFCGSPPPPGFRLPCCPAPTLDGLCHCQLKPGLPDTAGSEGIPLPACLARPEAHPTARAELAPPVEVFAAAPARREAPPVPPPRVSFR